MIRSIRKPGFLKIVSITMAMLFMNEIIFPTVAMALTGGPSQPEVESFAPIEATDMVDLFSGDFKYNIPLMDVDGYPININYNSNITMDQEASWVGLGWNLNPGVINRSMRGLPDEFCGDQVTKEFNLKEDKTYGLRIYLRPEVFSKNLDFISLGYILSYSTKNGFNVETSLGIAPTLSKIGAGALNVGLNFSSSTNGSFNFTPSVSYEADVKNQMDKGKITGTGKLGARIGFPINSIGGLQAMQLGVSARETSKTQKTGKQITNMSMGYNTTLSFVPNTYTPQISIPIENKSYDVNLNLGIDIMVVDALGAIGGYYLNQKVRESTVVKSAYGYLNNTIGTRDCNALLDFNREKDVIYHPEIKNLPITNRTYDIYSVQGQGVNSTYRPYSNDVGFIFDDFNQNTSSSFNAGVEIAATNVVKGGADITLNNVSTNSTVWSNMNAYVPDYYSAPKNNLLYENTNFKMVGESNVEADMNYPNKTAFNTATRLELFEFGGLDAVLKDKYINGYNFPAKVKREHRQKRNQFISILNGKEALLFGVEKNICSYNINQHNYLHELLTNPNLNYYSVIDRSNPIPPSSSWKHPSEVSINKTDGSRYVYGIPAYVTKQVESSFSVDEISQAPSNGLVTYTAQQDSKGNGTGFDNFYSKTILPPYAHSYLLTNVLSPEYIDLTGNGPTDDDMGNYTKFNYTSMFATTGSYYKWRTPYEEGMASYNEGAKHLNNDGKGSYIYGEKDIWFLHSIETKNYIVDFVLSDRCDAYGVKDDRGGRNTTNLQKKLKEIKLYSKKDKKENGVDAVPIKVVHFEYDYSLCKNVPNNDQSPYDADGWPNQRGKLTLKKIYFTYGKSMRGKLNAYQFEYNTFNPDYAPKACDRWGFYKPETNTQLGTTMNSYEFPYVDQQKINTDNYMAAWSLSQIQTPSGATVNMKYESDDYAYVQDKRAMQMMNIVGFSKNVPTSLSDASSSLYTGTFLFYTANNYVVIKVPEVVSGSEIQKKYFDGVSQLYFKCLVNMEGSKKEYISGYAKIDNYGIVGGGSSDYIWVKISDFDPERTNNNPVSVAAWRYCMESARYFLTGGIPPDEDLEVIDVIKALAGMNIINGLIDMASGPWVTAQNKSIAMTFDPGKSWARLDNPNYKKLGGGSRITEITISDNWASNPKEYGQIYDYTMIENEKTISSGVAAYEPMVGGDEIPHRTAVFYQTSGGFLQPDNYGFLENPMGESFFPAPSVGYRQVTVKNIQETGITKHATGKVVHEFYTAKEFPVRNNAITDLKAIPYKSGWLENMFSPDTYNKMYVSQGYLFETNDMHGKPKSQKVYAEGKNDAPISGVEYYYKQIGKQLNNLVNTIDKKGIKSEKLVSYDYDVINDFRECSTTTTQSGCQINLSFFFAGIFPIIISPVWPTYSRDVTQFRSAVTTKVINYYGVLQDVVKFDQSSRVKTSNELYDAESGEVLLTKTQNSFKDPLYSFTYPAHWVYSGMEPSFENTGFELFGDHPITSGTIDVENDLYPVKSNIVNKSARELFSSGDEVSYYYKTSSTSQNLIWKRAWVLDVTKFKVSLIDELGNKIPTGVLIFLKVMKSGRKNQHTLPIASLLTRKDPTPLLTTDNLVNAGIIESEAIEYDNTRKIYCGERNYQCKLEPTQEYKDFIKLFSYLEENNKFIKTQGTALNPGAIPPSYAPYNFITPINLLAPEYYPNYFTNLLKSKFQLQPGQNAIYFTGVEFPGSVSFGNYCITSDNIPNYQALANMSSNIIHFMLQYDYSNVKYFVSTNTIQFDKDTGCIDSKYFQWSPAKYVAKSNNSLVASHSDGELEGLSYNNEPIYALKAVPIPSFSTCGIPAGDVVNPFVNGILGSWQPRTSYKYLAQRKRTEESALKTTNLKTDGDYLSFSPFWKNNQLGKSEWSKANPMDNNWAWTNTVTIKDRNGSEVENKNALGIYSSALYGFSGNLATAVAANARHKEIASESFEDYWSDFSPECSKHLKILTLDGSPNRINTEQAHTGKYSLKIAGDNPVFYTYYSASANPQNFIKINESDCESRWSSQVLETRDEIIENELVMDSCDCKAKFSPESNKDYLVSYWIYTGGTIASNSNPILNISVNGTGVTLDPSITVGKPIEGWQRIERIVHFGPTATGSFTLSFIRNISNTVYMDDLRILPFNASMKAYVYDNVTKRLMAELDDNNYASFYEYDEDGSLVRVKKESEKGIFTIKEIRKNLQK